MWKSHYDANRLTYIWNSFRIYFVYSRKRIISRVEIINEILKGKIVSGNFVFPKLGWLKVNLVISGRNGIFPCYGNSDTGLKIVVQCYFRFTAYEYYEIWYLVLKNMFVLPYGMRKNTLVLIGHCWLLLAMICGYTSICLPFVSDW